VSFILDALKKTEKERQRRTLPDILTVQEIIAEKPASYRVWAYLLMAVLLLNAGILAWWMVASSTVEKNAQQKSKTDTVAQLSTNVVTQSESKRTTSFPDSLQPVRPQLRHPEKENVPAAIKSIPVRTDRKPDPRGEAEGIQDSRRKIMFGHSDAGGETRKIAEPAPDIVKPPVESVAIPSEQATLPMEAPDPNRIYKLKDLPPAILKSLPTFSVSALLYADNPSARLVRVNDQMMYEGQDLKEGVKLEEITRNGLVFSYRKYRFHVGTK
jgi:general secretion pathway protein B